MQQTRTYVTKEKSILDRYPDYEATIGIEVHVQLKTKSKIFCSCLNKVTKEPNVNICQICSGYPGALPVLNKKVVDYAILFGLATNCSISRISTFARKHYFYPDLPKDYQITQGERPICTNGFIPIRLKDGSIKKIRIMRIHMEEDAGKNIHMPDSNESLVNLNRTGTPLLEIVTEPDIANAQEAKAYLKALHSIVRYLGIGTGNMDEGAFRADTNISVKKKTDKELGTRCELKNINSFKFIGDATDYEIERQLELIAEGGTVKQETRLWNTVKKETAPMRTKEEAADYRYFQDPDLPLIQVNDEWISRIKQILPELPYERFDRLVKEGLTPYEADILVTDLALSNYYQEAAQHTKSKHLVNLILRDLMGHLKEKKISLSECKVTPKKLAELVDLLDKGTINSRAAQEVFTVVAQTGGDPSEVVKDKGLEQIGSVDKLEKIVQEIIATNTKQVEQYKGGNERVFGFFVGQAMKKTQGRGNPKILQNLLKKYLK